MTKPVRSILFAVASPVSIALLGPLPAKLASESWEVHIVSTGLGQERFARDADPAVSFHQINIEREPSFPSDLVSLVALFSLIRRIRPTIVVGATPKASLLAMIAAFTNGVRARVYFLWGLRLESSSGLLRLLMTVAEKTTARLATDILSVSASLMHRFTQLGLSESQKVSVLGYGSSKGVNLEVFRPARVTERLDLDQLADRIGLTPRVPVIGYFGRITADKGVDFLDKARRELNRLGVDHQVLVVGQNEIGSKFRWSTDADLRPPVLLGHRTDVPQLLRLTDVLCLPSLREGLPNVCLEASASSVPIVATRVTGTVDCVEDRVNGILVKLASSGALAEALAEVLTNPLLSSELRRNARPWLKGKFTEQAVIKAQVDYLSRLSSRAI